MQTVLSHIEDFLQENDFEIIIKDETYDDCLTLFLVKIHKQKHSHFDSYFPVAVEKVDKKMLLRCNFLGKSKYHTNLKELFKALREQNMTIGTKYDILHIINEYKAYIGTKNLEKALKDSNYFAKEHIIKMLDLNNRYEKYFNNENF